MVLGFWLDQSETSSGIFSFSDYKAIGCKFKAYIGHISTPPNGPVVCSRSERKQECQREAKMEIEENRERSLRALDFLTPNNPKGQLLPFPQFGSGSLYNPFWLKLSWVGFLSLTLRELCLTNIVAPHPYRHSESTRECWRGGGINSW